MKYLPAKGHGKCRKCDEPVSPGGSKPRFWCSRQCAAAHCAEMEAKHGSEFGLHKVIDLSEPITELEWRQLTTYAFWARGSFGRPPTMADVERAFWERADRESYICAVCDRGITDADGSDVCGRHWNLQEYRVNGKLMTRHDLARLLRVRPYVLDPAFNGVRGRGVVSVALLGKLVRDVPVFDFDDDR